MEVYCPTYPHSPFCPECGQISQRTLDPSGKRDRRSIDHDLMVVIMTWLMPDQTGTIGRREIDKRGIGRSRTNDDSKFS
jgi:hypothetical protein